MKIGCVDSKKITFNHRTMFILIFIMFSSGVLAMGNDDPLLFVGKIKSINFYDDGEGKVTDWDLEVSAIKDLQKFHIFLEGLINNNEPMFDNERSSEGEVELNYSRAISAYWDVSVGLKEKYYTGFPRENTTWVGVGARGLAPYFLESNINVFVSDENRSELNIELEKESMITQSVLLLSKSEIKVNGYNDINHAIGSGLSDVHFELRLAYRLTRKILPYLGMSYSFSAGNTKRYKKLNNANEKESEIFLGFSAWF